MPAACSRRDRRRRCGNWAGPKPCTNPAWMMPSSRSSSRREIARSHRTAPLRRRREHRSPMKRAASASKSNAWAMKLRRIRALVMKETRQVVRDPSSIAMGVVLPLILILLFGYGLSLDVKNVPIAVVIEESSNEAMELMASFQLSAYFKPQISQSMVLAQQLLLEQKVDGIVRIPSDFLRQ